ncbi:MAG: ABC transporter substrate-binding protein, partial [Actinomycetota bacterium]
MTTRSWRRRAIAGSLALALIAAACGDDDGGGSSDTAADGTAETGDTAGSTDATEASDSTDAPDTGDGAAAGSVVFAAEQWPDCLNPVTSCANASWLTWSVIHHILPKLMEVDADGNYQASPLIEEAPSLENGLITEDPFTITYNLVDGATWNDGSPITAEDVAFTWQAIMDSTG